MPFVSEQQRFSFIYSTSGSRGRFIISFISGLVLTHTLVIQAPTRNATVAATPKSITIKVDVNTQIKTEFLMCPKEVHTEANTAKSPAMATSIPSSPLMQPPISVWRARDMTTKNRPIKKIKNKNFFIFISPAYPVFLSINSEQTLLLQELIFTDTTACATIIHTGHIAINKDKGAYFFVEKLQIGLTRLSFKLIFYFLKAKCYIKRI